MKINLSEIPDEGRNYTFDRSTGELNEILSDLLGERAYSVDFTIKPLGNVYELKGFVKAATEDVCSMCGWDIEIPITTNFNEILIKDEEEYRKSHSTTGNQSVDFLAEGPSVTYYHGSQFDAGEFVHEGIASSTPFYPTCGKEGCERIEEVRQKQAELAREFEKADEVKAGHPAFAGLKDLLKS